MYADEVRRRSRKGSEMSKRNTECYNRVRFVMDDADGTLRFRRLKLDGAPFCDDVLRRLETYLRARPLEAVDLEEVRRIAVECRSECAGELVHVIAEQKAFFARHPSGASDDPAS